MADYHRACVVGLAIGMVLALSSTAIVNQTLNEKGLLRSDGGQASFSVLLFQDIAVIPMLVLAIALLMTMVGLSPALGTFLAGVVMARSEYRHELESDISPLKGIFLGVFFITVGAGIDFTLLSENASLVLGLTFGMIILKAGMLYGLAHFFRIQCGDKWLFALGLAQARVLVIAIDNKEAITNLARPDGG